MTPGGVVALCASIVTVCGGIAHLIRVSYRLVRTLAVTVEAVAKLTQIVAGHLDRHDSTGQHVRQEDFDQLATQVRNLEAAVRDLQGWFKPGLGRHVPAQETHSAEGGGDHPGRTPIGGSS